MENLCKDVKERGQRKKQDHDHPTVLLHFPNCQTTHKNTYESCFHSCATSCPTPGVLPGPLPSPVSETMSY